MIMSLFAKITLSQMLKNVNRRVVFLSKNRKLVRQESNLQSLPHGNRFTVCRTRTNMYLSPISKESSKLLGKYNYTTLFE